MGVYLRKNEIKKTIKVYNTQNTICGLCHCPFEIVELTTKAKKKYGYDYALIYNFHSHTSGASLIVVVRFYNDIKDIPQSTSECFELLSGKT